MRAEISLQNTEKDKKIGGQILVSAETPAKLGLDNAGTSS